MSTHCILFYKYHPLTSCPTTLELYRLAHEKFCKSLHLTGRILIGLSEEGEGINGTLAGGRNELSIYVNYVCGNEYSRVGDGDKYKAAAEAFRKESRDFFNKIGKEELVFHEVDFKWSSRSTHEPEETAQESKDVAVTKSKDQEVWFPDLNIKIVKEIISTGGAFSNITTKETSVGYLTPKEWHEEMKKLKEQTQCLTDVNSTSGQVATGKEDEVETILIDVRNHKECQIGTFLPGVAIDPNTRTFSQFPKWVKEHSACAGGGEGNKEVKSTASASDTSLDNKRILLYCTGGIRCEKASAFVRQMVPSNRGVYHLKGGIHKYLEEFGSKDGECAFVGKNFVFDRRGAMSGADCLDGVKSDNGEKVVGQCMYCGKPHDTFLPENVCTVCREPVLVCPNCVDDLRNKQSILRGLEDKQNMRVEFHCEDHFQAKTCYYTSLIGFTALELNDQIQQLQLYTKQFEGIGKKGKQKRRTIRKQIEKIEAFIKAKEGGVRSMEFETELQCRNCGSSTCSGGCWGFHGGNTRMINREKAESIAASQKSSICASINYQKVRTRVPSNQRPMKRLKREKELAEVERLQLCKPASDYKLPNGLRVPPPSIRVLRSSVKGKWCGKSLQEVMSTEFHEFDNRDWLDQVISAGLLRINGISVAKIAEDFNQNASGIVLKNMDTIERVVHWHEPPICVHDSISFTKHTMPKDVLATTDSDTSSLPCLYCVNKPSTVPVHPAGPYYANSLLLQLEAQEGLMPKSLIPCHRIDRCTSGVLLCTDDTNVARVIQGAMTSSEPGAIKKLYVARVKGKFPSSSSEGLVNSIVDASLTWHENVLEVDAPIAVQLSGNAGSNVSDETFGMMHRIVSSEGKHAISRFKLLSYDAKTDQSLVSCAPITGRGHQLRVHLQLIGHPIHNDVEYGGFLDFKYVDIQEKQSIESILNASKESTCLMDESVTEDEAKCAIAMCKCCSAGAEGVKVSFHSAQLLGGGHAIDLHACKYYVGLRQKGINEEEARMHDMVFTVSLPMWALEFQDFAQDEIDWLK